MGRYLQAQPVIGGALKPVRHVAAQRVGDAVDPTASGHDAHHVKPGTEARAVAVEHHGAYAGFFEEPLGRADDPIEHGHVKGVVLVAAGQRDHRDVIGDLDPDTLVAHAGLTLPGGKGPRSPRDQASSVISSPTDTVPGSTTAP